MNDLPILSVLIFLPLLGAVLTWLCGNVALSKKIALGFALLELLFSVVLLCLFQSEKDSFQFVEQARWIPSLNIQFLLGVDGISVLFLPLTALLTIMAIVSSWNTIQHLSSLHFALLLALEGISIGVLSALDLILFFLFWELTLPPIFFLIGLWGIGPKRRGAAMKYVLFMLAGGVPLLFAFLMLAMNHAKMVGNGSIPHDLSFSFPLLLNTPLPNELQATVFFLLFLGFAVKAPIVPLHTWLPTLAMESATHTTALLIGLKLGIYGLVRFTMPLAPLAAVQYSWAFGILGAVALIYGALIALQQTNLRRLLAYASVSHVGAVIIGLSALNAQGLQGAIFQLVNFSLIASSLMLIAGFIQHRLGSTDALHLGGLAKVMPRLTCFYFLFTSASMAIPLTSGFPAELLIVIGALTSHPTLGIATLAGTVLCAADMLSYTRRAFFGVTNARLEHTQDLRPRELALLCIPALLVLMLGLLPNQVLNINNKTVATWLNRLVAQPEAVKEPTEEVEQ
ncbi:NADH-quinone oxidoreductase subunit M [Patescibacteria group bacterium]|nr:NADH-quinone oxidoreductase subunit M [Patescibacteria group bacterium]